jgi:hypothetical protein
VSTNGLIKITSKIQRADTITDLRTIEIWRSKKGLPIITPKQNTLRSIENAAAIMIESLDTCDLPKLVRGLSFYISILPEIKQKER